MPDSRWFLLFTGVLLCCLTGCNIDLSSRQSPQGDDGTVAEGTIFSVKYDQGDGRVGGFTRVDAANAVPGGNGSWNIDARGKLTTKFLIITYPSDKRLGPLVIPADKLYEVQFGDGGIHTIRSSTDSGSHEH